MQNKANFPDTQMNASYVKTKNYEQNTMEAEPAKQTQSNPIKANFYTKAGPKNQVSKMFLSLRLYSYSVLGQSWPGRNRFEEHLRPLRLMGDNGGYSEDGQQQRYSYSTNNCAQKSNHKRLDKGHNVLD